MVQFAYRKRGKAERIARLREQAQRGGRRSQEVQAIARMQRELGPRPLPLGSLLRIETRYDALTGEYVRAEVYKSLRRENQRDVVVMHSRGVDLIEGISEGELRDRRWAAVKHRREIVED